MATGSASSSASGRQRAKDWQKLLVTSTSIIYDGERDFVWDPVKDVANIQKHGIPFAEASDAFYVDPVYVEETTRLDDSEQRWKAIGAVNGRAICVIYAERDDETRIISARAARRNERRKLSESAETS